MNKKEVARTILTILEPFAVENNIELKDLFSRKSTHKHRLAVLKRAAMRKLRKETDLTYAQIGRIFGVHHATVAQACKCVGKNYEGTDFK